MKYRSLTVSDLPSVFEFWNENYEISKRDTIERITAFLNKNEDLSTVAIDYDNVIVGTVLASFDGRKAYIQKMAIDKDLRGKGLGQEMLKYTLDKLKNIGALDVRVNCNEKTAPFYEKCGFSRKPIVSLQIRNY